MGVEFPDGRFHLGKFRGHLRPLGVAGQALRHKDPDGVGVAYLFPLGAP